MPFTVWVHSAGRRAFPTDVLVDRLQARVLRAAIAREPDAKEMRFTAGGWGLFLADDRGARMDAELDDRVDVLPVLGASEVNVWVERIAPLAASGGAGGE